MKRLAVILIISLYSILIANAQNKIKQLTIGDSLPYLTLKMLGTNGQLETNVSNFKGKAILIDFWGTWCAPCVGSIPKLDSLQKEFKDQLVILPVTDEPAKVVNAFFDNMGRAGKPRIASVIEDRELNQSFPHSTVPMYVLVDANGVIKATIYPDDLNRANIKKLIAGQPLNLALRIDKTLSSDVVKAVSLDRAFIQIMNDSTVVSCHLFTKVIPEIVGGAGTSMPGIINCQNMAIPGLFAIAYGKGWKKFFGGYSHLRLLTSDSVRFTDDSGVGGSNHHNQYRDIWRLQDGHEFNYILKVPPKDNDNKFDLMKQDLQTFFPDISAEIVSENRICYVLKRLHGKKMVSSKEQGKSSIERTPFFIKANNAPFQSLFLSIKLNYQSSNLQVVDETNYAGKIDFEVYGKTSDPAVLNAALNKYGLQFTKEERPVDILVIKDLKNPPKSPKL